MERVCLLIPAVRMFELNIIVFFSNLNQFYLFICLVKIADENAFLILENIKLKGFKIGDRCRGFSKYDAEIILEVSLFYTFEIAMLNLKIESGFDRKWPNFMHISLR